MKIIQKPSPNKWTGRNGKKITGIVFHSTWGGTAGSLSWLCNPASQVSCHYLIDEKGAVYQLVQDADTAWHAGIVDAGCLPSWADKKENFNRYVLGIELTDNKDPHWQYPDVQRQALIWLVNKLVEEHNLIRDKAHFLAHKELTPSTRSDPVGAFDFAWVLGSGATPPFNFDTTKKMPDEAWEQLGYGNYPAIERRWALDTLGEEYQKLSDEYDRIEARENPKEEIFLQANEDLKKENEHLKSQLAGTLIRPISNYTTKELLTELLKKLKP